MDQVEWRERPELRSPALVCAFKGWNDAGEAATAALGFLIDSFEAREIADIDPEGFYDFTAVRPTVRMDEGKTRVIEWPATTLHAASVPGTDHDLLLLQAIEPSLRWREFTELLIQMARDLGARMVVTLGALLADVPHSRPVPITGLSSDDALVHRLGLQQSGYEGPTGIVGVLHSACQEAGMPSASLWASVPHYVAAAPNPKAALALVRKLESLVGVSVDAEELEHSAADYDRQVSLAVQSDPDVQAFVERLERAAAEEEEEMGPQDLPSGDVLAREFQRFLRQRGPGQTE
jgi:proteasome assembly chaperone (PAC2) family protein